MSTPSSATVPAVGSISRAIMRAVVDLPEPDSPTIPSVLAARDGERRRPRRRGLAPRARAKMTPRVTGNRLVSPSDLDQRCADRSCAAHAAASARGRCRTPQAFASGRSASTQASACPPPSLDELGQPLTCTRRSGTRSAAAKRQPGGGSTATAAHRGSASAARALGVEDAAASRAAPRCTGAAGRANTSPQGPRSIARPAYITRPCRRRRRRSRGCG